VVVASVQGTVDWFHLTEELPTREWAAAYSEKQRINARILYVDPELKRVGLTLSPALVKGGPLPPPLPTGTVVQQAKVCRIDPGMGMLMRASTAVDGKTLARTAYVHVRSPLPTHLPFPFGSLSTGLSGGLSCDASLAVSCPLSYPSYMEARALRGSPAARRRTPPMDCRVGCDFRIAFLSPRSAVARRRPGTLLSLVHLTPSPLHRSTMQHASRIFLDTESEASFRVAQISEASDERMDKLEKSFKPGQQVPGRIIGCVSLPAVSWRELSR